jgi:arginyl-tRNA synthetase
VDGVADVDLVHVAFGTVLGEDGKPFKTRAGDTVGLEALLDEGVERAAAVVGSGEEGRAGMSAEDRRHVAETVGIGAIKYADLSQNRTTDYVFSFDKICKYVVPFEKSTHALAQVALRETAHEEQFFTNLVQVLLPVHAHELGYLAQSDR